MDEIECAWVATLLEGEGSFGLGAQGHRVRTVAIRQLRITCAMTDLDTIEKLHRITGIGNIAQESRTDKRRPYAKLLYVWHASKRGDVVPVLEAIRPHMGARRRAKIDELLAYAKANPLVYNQPLVHGTRRTYRKGCRCAECRAATATFQRDLRNRKKALVPPPVVADTAEYLAEAERLILAMADGELFVNEDIGKRMLANGWARLDRPRILHHVAAPQREVLGNPDSRQLPSPGWRQGGCGSRGPRLAVLKLAWTLTPSTTLADSSRMQHSRFPVPALRYIV